MKASISIVRIWIHLGLIPSADVSLYIWALDYLFFNLLTWGTLLFLGFVFNCVPRCLLFLILYTVFVYREKFQRLLLFQQTD